ncbi:hypothetical protein [Loktanella atrilutea]|nr:hypothetical protein [Loktanella atrilutea]
MLNTADVRALGQRDLTNWAKQVFAQKLDGLTNSQQIARISASGPDAADNLLWDEAAVRAWNLIEANGINVKWPTHQTPDSVLMSAAEADALQRVLTLLTNSLKTPAKAAELKTSFEAATGQPAPAAQHVVQLTCPPQYPSA